MRASTIFIPNQLQPVVKSHCNIGDTPSFGTTPASNKIETIMPNEAVNILILQGLARKFLFCQFWYHKFFRKFLIHPHLKNLNTIKDLLSNFPHFVPKTIPEKSQVNYNSS